MKRFKLSDLPPIPPFTWFCFAFGTLCWVLPLLIKWIGDR